MRLNLLAYLVFALAPGGFSYEEPIPSAQECPTCKNGSWTCDRKCNTNVHKEYAFDFRYTQGQCWEEIPRDSRSMLADVDMWCSIPLAQSFLSCRTMSNYDFTGVGVIPGCKGDATGSLLVREECVWVCKHGRPTARCLWEFDFAGSFFDGRLRACWLAEDCTTQNTVVSVVCEPNPPDNSTADINALQTDLNSALAAHQVAADELAKVQAEINEFSQKFGNLTAAELQERNSKEKAKLEAAEESLYLSQERLNGIKTELREAQKELEVATKLHDEVSDAHEMEKKQLQSMLLQATNQLNNSRFMIANMMTNHTAAKTKFAKQAKNLLHEVQRYADLLESERVSHKQTKSKLKSQESEAEEAKAWLMLALVLFGFVVVVCLGFVVALIIRQRKWRNLALSRASNMGAHVVLGRPVGATGGGTEDVGAPNFEAHHALPVKPGPRDNSEDDNDESKRLRSFQGQSTSWEAPLASRPSGTLKTAW